jgi:prepilin-type N-terminal cleavage/methylation domain-containing protein
MRHPVASPHRLSPGRQGRGARRGFTIAEVMMSVAIMSLAITTSLTTMQRSFMSLDSARNITLAAHIMQAEFESMRLNPWETIRDYPQMATLTIDSEFTNNPAIADRFILTRQAITIREGMRQITLTVSWTSFDGRALSRYYTTYYGENGLYDYFFNSF